MNFPSFSRSANFNPSLSVKNQSQDSSIRDHIESQNASNQQEKQSSSPNDQKKSHQISQSQHPHDNFEEMNQNDAELEPEVQLGLTGHKKIKNEILEAEENDLQDQSETDGRMRMEKEAKPISEFNILTIEGMFQKLTISQGESNILYQPHQYNEEERNMVSESLLKMFSKQCKIASSIEERKEIEEKPRNRIPFECFEFDMKDYIIGEILGQGLHGLVIKLKGRNCQSDAVLKLYTEEKAFTQEAAIISILQKAKEYELPKPFDRNYPLNHLQNKYFKTDEYYGLFLKAGVGSLLDFKNYLQETNKELSEQEIFVLTVHLLNEINSLHELSLCHRDIKPGNIVIDPEYFLPKLIDFSFASEISKAQGNPGTPGYRMEDFGMKSQEIERKDQLISRDYFALGITIINIMYPDCTFLTQKILKDRLGKLARFKNIEKKILAETLELCIFGKTEVTKDILKEERKNSVEIYDWKEKLKDISNKFGLWSKLEEYAEMLRENHCQSFKDYMAQKWSRSNKKKEPEMQKYISSLTLHMRENFRENPVRILENSLFSDEEQYIRNSIRNHPEKTEEKCYKIIDHLVMIDYKVFDPQLYSTVMAALFLNGFVDDATALGERAAKYQLFGDHDWILFNNVVFLITQRNLRDYRTITSEEYECCLKYLNSKYKEKFIYDLVRICKCAHDLGIKGNIGVPSDPFSQKGLILSYFEMDLFYEESYFFMNCCYLYATEIDKIIDESTREKIQKFVYGINFSERGKMLEVLNIADLESVLLTFNSFYEILIGGTLQNLTFLKEWLREGIYLKDKYIQLFQEGKKEQVWDILLSSNSMHAMIGFIILYNTLYDLQTKFDVDKWLNSDATKLLSNEELNLHFKKLQAEQTKKWSRQKFLDSILLFLREICENGIFLELDFKGVDKERLDSLSILGQKLKSILFPDYPRLRESYILLLDFERNLISVTGVKYAFELGDMNRAEHFFRNWRMESVEDLVILSLELSHYKKGFSHLPLRQICHQFSILKLKQLTITMKTQIQIKDEDFMEITNFISTQNDLMELTLEFNLCLITSHALESLADAIKEHENLEKLNVSLKNCPKIEEESIEIFLEMLKELKSEELKKLPKLEFVDLFFSACPGVISFLEPKDLSFKATVKIYLQEIKGILSDLDDFDNEEDDDWCTENYEFEG